ncbi:hypothetical protein M9980_11020 [Sphingomonas donggukensis]|uniref:DUF11 domain-containing protein n=1 Tax=Sphingomonas donggukensis TaxID=2949093 RepID=A0ABY4TUG1_9SPHN|nr:hypothetical protein [Sphingomonas donggukensis]URW75087.1 hypothetical protein M9980_11020 [Sphingomonas donggukensis]
MHLLPFNLKQFTRLLMLVVAAAVAPPALAQRIVNTATVAWDDGAHHTLQSNEVVLEPAAEATATLTTFRVAAGGSQVAAAPNSVCAARPVTILAGTSVASVAQTSVVHAGEPLIFRLLSARANIDPKRVDTIVAVLVTSAGDRETLTVSESGVDTGEFIGAITTQPSPPHPAAGDCILSLARGDTIAIECQTSGNQKPIATATVEVLVDPYGVSFDSEDGSLVSGVRVSLVDAATGQPARVFADDGITPAPSTVVTGVGMPPGDYRFPLVAAGRYRLLVVPPAPYAAPSRYTPASLAGLRRADGAPFAVGEGSYGDPFAVLSPAPVRIDIPLDRPPLAIAVTKTASRATATPGDAILYTISVTNPDGAHAKTGVVLTDRTPSELRLRSGSIRLDGVSPAAGLVEIGADGRTLRFALGTLGAGLTRRITYALEVRGDAPAGQAVNRATVVDARGGTGYASVGVGIVRASLATRLTILGRVTAGGCAGVRSDAGIAGVRVLLEDGSYAITDRDGRYHFDGAMPGSHVVRADAASLPAGARFVDCVRSVASADNADTRIVSGRGGGIVTADFAVAIDPSAARATARPAVPTSISDKAAAGGERDWFADGGPSIAWLFPEVDHNPRAPVVRVAIRHLPGQTIALSVDGKPVDAVAFDGSRTAPQGGFAVSLWRAIPLKRAVTKLVAVVHNADGTVAATLTRDVHFVAEAAHAEFVASASRLIADGVTQPVIAVRITDRAGRPVHAGVTGEVVLSAPYAPALEIDAEQARTLAGLERARPTWRIVGDDGIAYLALAPTTASGALSLDFIFRDRDTVRTQRIDGWMEAGDRPWTVVGLAEAGIGTRVEPLSGGAVTDTLNLDGRVALYAKGRILGRWLLTLAYDSARRRGDVPLGGGFDPQAYYTVYGDRSERRADAASTARLYVKLERRQFYALFGDIEAGFGDTVLGRYQRAATGFKSELRAGGFAATAFAAKTPTRHRRDEIQGSGLAGGYRLSARAIVANSERVTIEVRDRLRSERIVERRSLTRFVDYDIDYATGSLSFAHPVLSRSESLDPQFVIVDYETDDRGDGSLNAGVRASWTSRSGALRVGATAIRDADESRVTDIAAADARIRLGAANEVRAEIAASRANRANGIDTAWLVEAEHHDARIDVLAYARSADAGFGIGQQNFAERGRRKLGIDARWKAAPGLDASVSAWQDDALGDDDRRRAIRARAEYDLGDTRLRLGVVHATDRVAAGEVSSTLLEAGATRHLFDNRLELDAQSQIALGASASIDFPVRHVLGARLSVTPSLKLVGAYEIAKGDGIDARTSRIGAEWEPWSGARLSTTLADRSNAGTSAAIGVSQSLTIANGLTADLTIDANRAIGGIDPDRVVNPAHPVATGGYLAGGALTETFTAYSGGLSYRSGLWSGTGRLEYRAGDLGDRAGVTVAGLRQMGDGSALGGVGSWTRISGPTGAVAETVDFAISGAWRPASSALALLGKVEFRDDRASGTVAANTASRRLIASTALDWSPFSRVAVDRSQRRGIQLTLAVRETRDRIDGFALEGLSAYVGGDVRLGLAEHWDISIGGSVRAGDGGRALDYAFGPTLTLVPARSMQLLVGWNLIGYDDRDFAAFRATRNGAFATVRMGFDEKSLAFLGLGR